MSEKTQRQGHCLCGAVTITANASSGVGVCHCDMCRRWGGGPFMDLDCGPEVAIEGEQNVTVYDSSAWAERAFCRQCGTHLFYRLKENREHMIPVGFFDDNENLVFDIQVFVEEKPSFYSFAEKMKEMTGAELMAKYAPESATE